MTRTVVIGGGIAGLAASALLAREGHQVRLIERQQRLGGRAGCKSIDGFRFETGPSWYLMPRVYEHFFNLLGTTSAEELDLVTLNPGYRVFPEPRHGERPTPVTIPYGLDDVTRVFDELEPGSASRLRRYVSSAHEATGLAERYFLYNPFTNWRSLLAREVLSKLPRLTRLLFEPLEHFVHSQFRHPVLRQVLGYPAVFLGTDPRRAPAIYHLMSALDLAEGVQYPVGGFCSIVERFERLARQHGVDIVTGANVTRIETRKRNRRTSVAGLRWRSEGGQEHTERADYVVSTADLHHTETELLPPASRTFPERWWKRRQSGPGAVLLMLGVKGKLPQLEHHSLFFASDWNANFDAIFGPSTKSPDPASLYVCKPSTTEAEVAPQACESLFVLVPMPADTSIGAGGTSGEGDPRVEQAADRAIDQIAEWAGIADLRQRIVVRETLGPGDFARDYSSWRGSMLGPSHILRQSAMFRAQNASKRVDGLFYAGATTAPGVGVPMCLISAELVLKRIRGDGSAGPTAPVRKNQ